MIRRRDANENVVRRALRVFGNDVEVTIVVEDVRVDQFVLRIDSGSDSILRYEIPVRKLELRVLVQRFHVRVRRRAVEIVVALLHVLAVVALASGESEQTFLQNRISSVPQCERETKPALAIGDTEQSVLAPAIRATASHVMGEALPNVAGRGVILAHRTPLSLGEVGSPALPVQVAPGVFVEANRFGSRHGSNRYCTTRTLGRPKWAWSVERRA